ERGQILVGGTHTRLKPESGLVVADRLVRFAPILEQIRKVALGIGMGWIERDGTAIRSHRLVETAQFLQDDAIIRVIARVYIVRGDCAADQFGGAGMFALLMRD